MTRKLYLGSLLSVVLAVAIYFGGVLMSDPAGTLAALRRLSGAGWALVLALSLINYMVRYGRWEQAIYRLVGRRLPLISHALKYIAGFAFTTTPGKAGEAFRCILLKQEGIGHDVSLAALVYERVLDVATMLVLAGFALSAFPRYHWMLWLACALLAGFLIALHGGLLTTFCQRVARVIGGRIANLLLHVSHLLEHSRQLLGWQPLLLGLLLGVFAWGSEGVGLYAILHGLHVAVPLTLAIGIYALAMLGGAFSFIPGGIGGAEAVMVLCLTLLGTPLPTAMAATLLCRITTLWFAMVLGLLACAKLAVTPTTRNALQATDAP